MHHLIHGFPICLGAELEALVLRLESVCAVLDQLQLDLKIVDLLFVFLNLGSVS